MNTSTHAQVHACTCPTAPCPTHNRHPTLSFPCPTSSFPCPASCPTMSNPSSYHVQPRPTHVQSLVRPVFDLVLPVPNPLSYHVQPHILPCQNQSYHAQACPTHVRPFVITCLTYYHVKTQPVGIMRTKLENESDIKHQQKHACGGVYVVRVGVCVCVARARIHAQHKSARHFCRMCRPMPASGTGPMDLACGPNLWPAAHGRNQPTGGPIRWLS